MQTLSLSLDQPEILAGVALLALGAGFVRGYTGFGGPAIMIVVLTFWFAPASVLGKVLVMDMMSNLKLVAATIRDVNWTQVGVLMLGCFIGTPVGLWALANFDDALMQQCIAFLALAGALVLLSGWRAKSEPGIKLMLVVGIAAGVAMSATGIALIAMVFLYSGPSSTTGSRANAVVWMFLVSIVLLSAYGYTGFLTLDDTWRAAVVGIAYLAGAMFGASGFNRSAEATVRRAAVWLLFSLAVIGVIV